MRNRGLPTRQDFRDHGTEQHVKIEPKNLRVLLSTLFPFGLSIPCRRNSPV